MTIWDVAERRSNSCYVFPSVFLVIILTCFSVGKCQKSQIDPCSASSNFILQECLSALDDGVTELDLSGRSITLIPPEGFSKFSGVILLDLSNNLLRSVSANTFHGLHDLKTLKLNNNLIESLDGPSTAWISFIPTLQEVTMSSNRFNCDCSLTWLVGLLATDDIIQDAAGLECSAPRAFTGLLIKNMPSNFADLMCKDPSQRLDACGSPGMFPCAQTIAIRQSPILCIPQHQVCDGLPQCSSVDSSDESPFICNALRQRVRFLPSAGNGLRPVPSLPNGFPRFPVSQTSPVIFPKSICRKGTFPCWSGNQCITLTAVCDGRLDCIDGADEDVTRCETIITLAKPVETSSFSPTNAAVSSTMVTTTGSPSGSISHTDMQETVSESYSQEGPTPSTLNWSSNPDQPNVKLAEILSEPLLPTTGSFSSTVGSTNGDGINENIFRLNDLSQATTDSSFAAGTSQREKTFQELHSSAIFPQLTKDAKNFQSGFLPADTPAKNEDLAGGSTETMTNNSDGSIRPHGKAGDADNSVATQAKPHGIRIISLPHNDVNVTWSAPIWPAEWNLIAYSVCWEIENSEHGAKIRKKKSPLLSTVVHEYALHHILPDESLKIAVTAIYTETGKRRKHEVVSDPVYRTIDPKLHTSGKDFVPALSSRQRTAGSAMAFEDVLGLSLGGAFAGLMMFLLVLYLYRRKRANLAHLPRTTVRALRMRKVERYLSPRNVKNNRSLSMEPIYAEPENGYHEIDAPPDTRTSQKVALPTRALQGEQSHPDAGYVEMLDSAESTYYGNPANGSSSHCSECSCYSFTVSRRQILMDPRANTQYHGSSSGLYSASELSQGTSIYSGHPSTRHMPVCRPPKQSDGRSVFTQSFSGPNNPPGSGRRFGDTLGSGSVRVDSSASFAAGRLKCSANSVHDRV